MKKIFKNFNFKKLLSTAAWAGVIAGLFFALAFVEQEEKQVKGKKIFVNIDFTNNNTFIDATDVNTFLKERNDTIANKEISKVDINKIEKSLQTHPAVLSAQVSLSIDGNMKISIKQRDPLVRVFNNMGESYYLDKQAKLMPLSENYTADVPVATGWIWESFSKCDKLNFKEVFENEKLSGIFQLDDIYSIAEYIHKDKLLSSLIHQLNMNKSGEFELYPAIGDQKIIFGKCEELDKKFEKLKVFYTEGLNKINGWNNYTTIDLRFDGQVVCKRKNNIEQNKKEPTKQVIALKNKTKNETN
ncbi:MAG: cell division protein FtsQ/DivIB [Bacteroidota bacterium]|jgi:cell division protein FtsQ